MIAGGNLSGTPYWAATDCTLVVAFDAGLSTKLATMQMEQNNPYISWDLAERKAACDFAETVAAVFEKMAIAEQQLGKDLQSCFAAGFEELGQQMLPCPQCPKYQQAPLRLLGSFVIQTSYSILVVVAVAAAERTRSSTIAEESAVASYPECLDTRARWIQRHTIAAGVAAQKTSSMRAPSTMQEIQLSEEQKVAADRDVVAGVVRTCFEGREDACQAFGDTH
jgi:hypothetical protein